MQAHPQYTDCHINTYIYYFSIKRNVPSSSRVNAELIHLVKLGNVSFFPSVANAVVRLLLFIRDGGVMRRLQDGGDNQ